MALFRAAQKHMDIMNTDLVVSDDGQDSSDVSGDEGEDDNDEDEEPAGDDSDSDEGDEDTLVARKEVDADEEDSDGEGNDEEERAAFLDDFVPTTLEGRNAFRCKVCPNVKLFNEQDVLNHVQSKKHRRACVTPEEIARLRARNQRKSAKRRLKHQTEMDAKKALEKVAKEQEVKDESGKKDAATKVHGKAADGKPAKAATKRTKSASTEEPSVKKAKKSAKA